MVAIQCQRCEKAPILLDFELVDNKTIRLLLFCPFCEQAAELDVNMYDFQEDEGDYGYGMYL